MREWEGVRLVTDNMSQRDGQVSWFDEDYINLLNQVENCDSIADRRQKASSIWGEDEITPTVDRTKQI